MRPLEENDHVGLESLLRANLGAMRRIKGSQYVPYTVVANPLVSGNFIDKFPLTEIHDWDMYRNREGLCYPNEFRMMEQFCRDCLPGVRRLADRQKARAAAAQYRQRSNPNPNHGQRDFHRDRGRGKNSEHDKKRELYLTVQPQTWRMPVSRSAPQGEGWPLPN